MNGEDAGAQFGIARPAITPENELVILAWNFCGGWNPGLIEAAAAYYGIADLDALIDLLLAMRDFIQERAEALRKLGG